MYCDIWQSPVFPDVTPPPKAHQPQKPKPKPVLGAVPVPATPSCQFSAPYAAAGAAATTTRAAETMSPSRDRKMAVLYALITSSHGDISPEDCARAA